MRPAIFKLHLFADNSSMVDSEPHGGCPLTASKRAWWGVGECRLFKPPTPNARRLERATWNAPADSVPFETDAKWRKKKERGFPRWWCVFVSVKTCFKNHKEFQWINYQSPTFPTFHMNKTHKNLTSLGTHEKWISKLGFFNFFLQAMCLLIYPYYVIQGSFVIDKKLVKETLLIFTKAFLSEMLKRRVMLA